MNTKTLIVCAAMVTFMIGTASAQQMVKGNIATIDEPAGDIYIDPAAPALLDRMEPSPPIATRLGTAYCSMRCTPATECRSRSKPSTASRQSQSWKRNEANRSEANFE